MLTRALSSGRFVLPLLLVVACWPSMADEVRRPRVTIPPAPPTSPQQTMGAQTDAEKQAEDSGNPVAGGDPAGQPPPADTPPPPLEQAAPMRPVYAPGNSEQVKQTVAPLVDGISSVNTMAIHFTLTPGDYVVVAGRGFGAATGALEAVLPGFPNNAVPLAVSDWDDGTVKAQLPVGITGVLDGPLKLRLTTSGQQQFDSKPGNFKARRQAYIVTTNLTQYLTFPKEYELGRQPNGTYGARDDGSVYRYTVEAILPVATCEGTDRLSAKSLPGGFVVDSLEMDAPELRGPNFNALTKFQQSQLGNADTWYRGYYALKQVAPGQFDVHRACQRQGPWPDYAPLLGSLAEHTTDSSYRIPFVSAYRVRVKLFGPQGTQPPF